MRMPAAVRLSDGPVFSATELLARLDGHEADLVLPMERLFDDLPNVVFFVKDRAGRYLCANHTLAQRLGLREKTAILGKKPSDLFPPALAARYERQDKRVLETGKPVLHQLELHLYPGNRRGWCLTNKYPVADRSTGEVSALMGISRDVETSARGAEARGFPELAQALEALHARIADPPALEELADLCGLSIARFGQLIHRLFHLTPRDLAMQIRLDEALHLLATTELSLSEIALATGFCDQSAFTRHFRKLTGLPPGTFRTQAREPNGAQK
jgi:PAS domain S-box-containing protein